MLEDYVRLTLGIKLEHNDSTQFEYQPNARLSVTPADDFTAWTAVSRAVQVPGRNLDAVSGTILPGALPGTGGVVFGAGFGNQSLDATELIAYELGMRWQPNDRSELDVAGFANFYNNLVDGAAGPFIAGYFPALVIPISSVNQGKAETKGVEITGKYEINDWWRATANYSYINIQIQDNGSGLFGEGVDPQQQVSIRSSMDLGRNVEFDLWGRFVDKLPATAIDAYFDLDVRLAWRFRENAEIALVGQNLIDPTRIEFGPDRIDPTQITGVERSFYLQLTMEF